MFSHVLTQIDRGMGNPASPYGEIIFAGAKARASKRRRDPCWTSLDLNVSNSIALVKRYATHSYWSNPTSSPECSISR